MSVAPFTGAVTFPFSIRYASLAENTKRPDVMSTWPPPKFTAYSPLSTDAMISSRACGPASM